MTLRPIDLILIHCAATPNGHWHSVDDIDRWHGERGFQRRPTTDEARRWNPRLQHVGYHWVIYTNGTVATGRHVSEIGAHTSGHNARSIGVCLIGTDQFTPLQWARLRDQVEHLAARHHVPLQLATADTRWRGICGHRDTGARKRCPGFSVADWLAGGLCPLPGHVLEMPS